MKTFIYALLYFVPLSFLISCNNEDILFDDSSIEADERSPYISPKMQEILAMIDTCTTAIPFEKLVPVPDSVLFYSASIDGDPVLLNTKATEILSYSGSTYVSVLYSLKLTTLTETQALNFGFTQTNRTYYVTCWAIEYTFFDSRNIKRYKVANENIGIDPNDLNQRGYNIGQLAPGVYTFTSYVWGISTTNGSNYYISEILPRLYIGGYYSPISEIDDWKNMITWNYLAYD